MTRRTRYFVIASLLVLCVGVGTGLVAYYAGFPIAFAQQGPDELQLIPRNAALVAYANVHEVMVSSLRERLRSAMPDKPDGQHEFENQTGINIEADIDHVVASLVPSSEGNPKGVMIATGRFDETRIDALMREHGAEVEDHKGRRLLIADHTGNMLSLAFIEPGMVALGSSDLVRNAIDLKDGGESVRGNGEIMNLVRSLDRGNIWAVGRFDVLTAQAHLPSRVANELPPVTWVSASAHVNGGLYGELRAQTRDQESANSLRDVVRGVIALGRLQADAHPELEAVLRTLQLGGSGSTVALSFEVPADVIDLLGAAAGRR